jgi:hypothetical protein
MNELEPMDKALIDLARGAHEPGDDDRARVRGRLAGRLGLGAGLAVVSTTLASSSSGAAAVTTVGAVAGGAATGGGTALLMVKVLAGLAVVAAVGGGGIAYHRATSAPAPMTQNAITPAPQDPSREPPMASPSPAVVIATPPVPATPSATVVPRQAMVPASPRQPVSPRPVAPTIGTSIETYRALPAPVVESRPVPIAPTTLEAETRLVHAGLAALHGGDAVRALALFDEHARTFPNGVLAEERDVERIEALCSLGRSDGVRAAATQFLRAHPGSPLVARVRASCAAANGPF